MDILNFALICGAIGVAYGLVTTTWVLKQDPGSERMQEISAAVQEGAGAFLNRQYKTVAMVGAVPLYPALWSWQIYRHRISHRRGRLCPLRLHRYVCGRAGQYPDCPGSFQQHFPCLVGSF